MDAELRNELETRLLEERDRLQEDLNTALEEGRENRAEESGDLSRLKSHPADSASQAEEADTDLRIAERATERVNRVDAALARLREQPDDYGQCEVCGEVIDPDRLRVVPWTTRCVDHVKSAEEVSAS